ncbi:hypothetical protein P22_3248 [Propionispora sp. 2/2-37]|jgi:hypothetical protein|uniref:hypothetical protein n=1 Tax=Propionispora sp. 2/2-37 TaxID=1677858 RepID=UPI0006BB5B4F|nr:hypothetical protein [Propionispora sp. 2/2-37]CUH97122.1 hypothetical protein P22_3248 [Propionispora sp. 2/2-37]
MKYAKGTIFEANDETYMLVGKMYCGLGVDGYVLAPQDAKNTEVLVYTAEEIEEGIEAGWLTIKC